MIAQLKSESIEVVLGCSGNRYYYTVKRPNRDSLTIGLAGIDLTLADIWICLRDYQTRYRGEIEVLK